MSRQNVEVVRAAVAAWQRDDLDAFLATLDPSIEWQTAMEGLVEGAEGVYRGHEGARRAWSQYRSEWEIIDLHWDSEFRDLGERVLVLGRVRMRGRASGLEFESPVARLLTVREGKIIHSEDYFDHAQGLSAAGLSQ